MRNMRIPLILALLSFAAFMVAQPVSGDEITKTYEFELHGWHEIGAKDGPVTLHRIKLDPKEGRFTKSAIARPYNQEYLETVRIQLEYTNESSGPWNARLTLRWLDEEGRVIDGISGNEKLEKKSARKVVNLSVSTFKYGLERAKTLEVNVHFQP